MSENARPAGGTRTTFGTQPSSRKLSAPAYGFGSGTREQQDWVACWSTFLTIAIAHGTARVPLMASILSRMLKLAEL